MWRIEAAVDADAATTPSEAEPMKVLQSIWDASAVATASRGDLRFMPFSEGVDLSKLAELRTLKGHSSPVRCGVHCTFVLTCVRCRSIALPCFRTGGASCLGRGQHAQGVGRGDRRVRGDAGRALERALRRPLYFCDDLASS